MEPILKWAGGKRLLLPQITEIIDTLGFSPLKNTYFEPFFGGGAITFGLEYPSCIISDINAELINVYEIIKRNPKELIEVLKEHQIKNTKEYYLKIRQLDRISNYSSLSAIEKAARVIYLNKTCYNGLYRVNRKGQFNVPYGKQGNPDIVMQERIIAISNYLNSNAITILNTDYHTAVETAQENDMVYFDPPYDYEDENGFTAYVVDGFDRKALQDLKQCCDELLARGCHIVLSNNDTSFVNNLFSDEQYSIKHIDAHRFINRKADGRCKVAEVLVYA